MILAKPVAKLIDHGIAALGAPPALGGVLIAIIVFTPEGLTALRAALANQLQRAVNPVPGRRRLDHRPHRPGDPRASGCSPGKTVILGLDPTGVVLLAVTLALSILTFCGLRTTVLEGAVHLVMFLVYRGADLQPMSPAQRLPARSPAAPAHPRAAAAGSAATAKPKRRR